MQPRHMDLILSVFTTVIRVCGTGGHRKGYFGALVSGEVKGRIEKREEKKSHLVVCVWRERERGEKMIRTWSLERNNTRASWL